jgi:hypothetical protein
MASLPVEVPETPSLPPGLLLPGGGGVPDLGGQANMSLTSAGDVRSTPEGQSDVQLDSRARAGLHVETSEDGGPASLGADLRAAAEAAVNLPDAGSLLP